MDAFGSASAATAVEATFALHCFMTGTSYLIVMGDLCPQLASYLCGVNSGLLVERRLWIVIFGFAIELPLFWQRTLEALNVSSAIGNAAVVLVTLLTAAFALGLLPTAEPAHPAPLYPPATGESSMVGGALGVLGVFVFAFACAMNVPTLVLELEAATIARVDSVLVCGVGLSALFYVLVGWLGSSAFGADVHANLLASFPLGESAASMAACIECWSGVIARLAMTFTVVTTYPLLMHPTRVSLANLALGRHASRLRPAEWAGLTISIFMASLGVALVVDSLETALSLVGGSTGMLIGFVFPALFYVRIAATRAHEQALRLREEEVQEDEDTAYRPFGAYKHFFGASKAGGSPVTKAAADPLGLGADRKRRAIALAIAVGGTLLVPVLVGVQIAKAVA